MSIANACRSLVCTGAEQTAANAPIARRLLLTVLITAGLGMAMGCQPAKMKAIPKVLFVCQFGTAKSAIAREIFRKRARERGLQVAAFSRGITPGEHVSPQLRARLAADGIRSDREPLRKLDFADARGADFVVAFNPLPANLSVPRVRDWSGLPSMNDEYRKSRADLDRRIDALLDEIAADPRFGG